MWQPKHSIIPSTTTFFIKLEISLCVFLCESVEHVKHTSTPCQDNNHCQSECNKCQHEIYTVLTILRSWWSSRNISWYRLLHVFLLLLSFDLFIDKLLRFFKFCRSSCLIILMSVINRIMHRLQRIIYIHWYFFSFIIHCLLLLRLCSCYFLRINNFMRWIYRRSLNNIHWDAINFLHPLLILFARLLVCGWWTCIYSVIVHEVFKDWIFISLASCFYIYDTNL